jgi:hypothetical protein
LAKQAAVKDAGEGAD